MPATKKNAVFSVYSVMQRLKENERTPQLISVDIEAARVPRLSEAASSTRSLKEDALRELMATSEMTTPLIRLIANDAVNSSVSV